MPYTFTGVDQLVEDFTLSFQIFAILGRESTPDELAFLSEPGSGF